MQSLDALDQDTLIAPTTDTNYCVKMKKLIPSVSHVLVVCWGDAVGYVGMGIDGERVKELVVVVIIAVAA